MRALYLTIIIFILALTSFSQNDSIQFEIYDFINSIDRLETKGNTFLHESGSPTGLLLKPKKIKKFNYRFCFFTDSVYYTNTVFWEENMTKKDKAFMVDQMRKLKQFKWDKERINKDLKFISEKDAQQYSEELVKNWNTKSTQIKTLIKYSAPIFNKNHNIALVYTSTYSGPRTASWGIDIYLLKDGNWIYIGHKPLGMS